MNELSAKPSPQPPSGLLRAIAAITCVEFLETGLVIFSAGQIMAGLHLSPEAFALAFTLYGVAAIFMLYKHRWIVERYGYQRFVLVSLAVFALGGLLCATATGFGQYALGRVLQGASGATFFTAGRMEIDRLPATARLRGLFCFIGSLLGASCLAPIAAALLMEAWGWRALFWFSLPLTLSVACIATPHLSSDITPPEQRSEEHWGWLLWLALGIFGLQYAIEELPSEAAASPAHLLLLAAVSVAILSTFAWRQWRKERPLINYRGLLQRRYLLGIALYLTGYGLAAATGFLLPVFFKEALGLPMLTKALVLAFGLAGSVLTAMLHAALAVRRPRPRAFMLAGLLCYSIACFAFSQARLLTDWHLLLLPTLLCGIAIPLFIGPVAFGTFSELAPAVFSHGYQVKNIIRQLGISSSVSITTVLLQRYYTTEAARIPADFQPDWAQALHGLSSASAGLISPLSLACGDVFFWLALVPLPVAVLVSRQRIFR